MNWIRRLFLPAPVPPREEIQRLHDEELDLMRQTRERLRQLREQVTALEAHNGHTKDGR